MRLRSACDRSELLSLLQVLDLHRPGFSGEMAQKVVKVLTYIVSEPEQLALMKFIIA